MVIEDFWVLARIDEEKAIIPGGKVAKIAQKNKGICCPMRDDLFIHCTHPS